MQRRSRLVVPAILLISIAACAILLHLRSSSLLLSPVPIPNQLDLDFADEEAAMIAEMAVEPQLLTYLAEDFCNVELCRCGSWAEWIILAPDSVWTVEELQFVRTTLITTISALEDAGLDCYGLLSGYCFRRSQGIYLDGKLGTVARVQHDAQEIVLADGALLKQWGFYIYHELGHVVDRRLERALTREFHLLTTGEDGVCGEQTADGFWLDKFARDRPEEATADAFALWIVLHHTTNPEPVFWMRPEEARYETIAGVMDKALRQIALRNASLRSVKN